MLMFSIKKFLGNDILLYEILWYAKQNQTTTTKRQKTQNTKQNPFCVVADLS